MTGNDTPIDRNPSHRFFRSLPIPLLASAGAVLLALAPAAAAPRDPLKIAKKDVMVKTTIEVADGLSATLTEFFTGEKSEKTGINLLLGLHRIEGDERTLVASRDFNAEAGGYVSRGSLEVVDLDRDGMKEVLVSYHHKEQAGTTRIDLDVFKVTSTGIALVWSGPIRVDTAGSSSGVAAPDRERFSREVGYLRTAAAEGRKIHFTKTVSVAAGVPFNPPKVLEEEFDLAGAGPGKTPAKTPAASHDG